MLGPVSVIVCSLQTRIENKRGIPLILMSALQAETCTVNLIHELAALELQMGDGLTKMQIPGPPEHQYLW